jgi:hypothetical protein
VVSSSADAISKIVGVKNRPSHRRGWECATALISRLISGTTSCSTPSLRGEVRHVIFALGDDAGDQLGGDPPLTQPHLEPRDVLGRAADVQSVDDAENPQGA